eukprot:g22512.t1
MGEVPDDWRVANVVSLFKKGCKEKPGNYGPDIGESSSEYHAQFWLPCDRKDIVKLKRVLKRFTRMLLGVEGLSYKERLDSLGLLLLEHRRLRGDLIEVYKIMRAINRGDGICLFIEMRNFKTREDIKVRGESFKKDIRDKFFAQTVVRMWNEHPNEVMDAGAITMFKSHLDENMNREGLEGYGPGAG